MPAHPKVRVIDDHDNPAEHPSGKYPAYAHVGDDGTITVVLSYHGLLRAIRDDQVTTVEAIAQVGISTRAVRQAFQEHFGPGAAAPRVGTVGDDEHRPGGDYHTPRAGSGSVQAVDTHRQSDGGDPDSGEPDRGEPDRGGG